MKRLSFVIALFVTVMAISGCTASTEYLDDIADLKNRVTKLETLCSQMNGNITSLQTLASAVQTGNYITSVTPISYGGENIGYTIAFATGDPITIYNGTNGKDGKDGEDGRTPQIGVRQDTDGQWYWTVDSNWLLDLNGQKVKAVGIDGNDGTNGKDGVTPQLKIENDYWYISTDKGATWTKLSKAKGEDGNDGQDGTGGDSMFTHIDYSTSEDYVIFTLSNGVNIKVPTWTAFDRLNTLCNEMNSNLEGIGTILDAIDQSLFIKSVSTMIENGKEIGYIITFSNDEKINIYHGRDGENGSGGGSGHTPQMGVKQHTDGVWYWTVDGEWLLDANGQKVKAVGIDGNDGTNGKDGVTPQLKIENGYWYVSMDKGATWTQYGKATGENGADGDSFFKSVTQDENNVYFTLSDDTKITIPKASILEISFDHEGEIPLTIGVKKDITYTVTSSLTSVNVEVTTSSNIEVKVTPADAGGLTGTISIRATSSINEFSKIVVMVDNGAKMIMRSLKPVGKSGHEWVDLGLPSGLKWATCNVGANAPEEYGDYFAWGEIEPYYVSQDPLTWKSGKEAGYDWDSYRWISGSTYTLTKYNTSSTYGLVDNKTTLDLDDDAARANWGGSWRMPTSDDFQELFDNCTQELTFLNGTYCIRITSKNNGDSIFLPAAGYWKGLKKLNDFYYWSSSLYQVNDRPTFANAAAWNTSPSITPFSQNNTLRHEGLPVRPVYDDSSTSQVTEPEAIDLGLPSGLKWATCNVGANSPEEYGDYFAWGEITPYYVSQEPLVWKTGKEAGYAWDTYRWCDRGGLKLNKYNNSSAYGPIVDDKTTLDIEDDAARANWGGNWRMPTQEEFDELFDSRYCATEWTEQNGVFGIRIISNNNSNSIFLPAAGCRDGTIRREHFEQDAKGHYWSSDLYTRTPNLAWYLRFSYLGGNTHAENRCYGSSIRPVCE